MTQILPIAALLVVFLSGGVAAKDLEVPIHKISAAGSGEKSAR